MTEIKEIEKDLLREIVNIGLAKAADSLSVISKDKVFITVPDVVFVNNGKSTDVLNKYSDIYTIVKSEILGDLTGRVIMLYTASHIARLAEVCLKENYILGKDREEMQLSMLIEITNILTGALVSQIADILKLHMYGSPPEAITENVPQKLNGILNHVPEDRPFVFVVKTHFINSGKLVELPMVLIFGIKTIDKIIGIIRKNDGNIRFMTNS